MPKARVLFVDDEASIRLTLPEILKRHGFDVRSEGTVSDALAAISEDPFDVLIADLNIGMPGDGFTVVSAMRRTQPDAVTIILTGYPAFETALEAIRSQVDDYAVKPADIDELVQVIEDKLKHREPHRPLQKQRVAAILRENTDHVVRAYIDGVRRLNGIAELDLSDQQLADNVPLMVGELIAILESGEPSKRARLTRAAEHGRVRREQGFELQSLIAEHSVFRQVLLNSIQENLLAVDVSNVLTDILHIEQASDRQLGQAVEAFLSTEKAAA